MTQTEAETEKQRRVDALRREMRYIAQHLDPPAMARGGIDWNDLSRRLDGVPFSSNIQGAPGEPGSIPSAETLARIAGCVRRLLPDYSAARLYVAAGWLTEEDCRRYVGHPQDKGRPATETEWAASPDGPIERRLARAVSWSEAEEWGEADEMWIRDLIRLIERAPRWVRDRSPSEPHPPEERAPNEEPNGYA